MHFHNNKLPKERPQCICLSIILIDSIYRKKIKTMNENMFLKKKRCLNILLMI